MEDVKQIKDMDPEARNLEGYLYPRIHMTFRLTHAKSSYRDDGQRFSLFGRKQQGWKALP